ncbi:RNA-directed DNA polymerase, eukaryota, reverse transcriptase zinc-binding domain protein [Tanacetum coccineum]|uniref:RNA-directed DNA polymerase, eukaryota, reverse transcriptase zinc-binding domain protein n=1 Tax=Tanacetum coccineum TaxID=301880 RepID=A0ABQ5EAM1_9ASTR
MLLFKVDFEKAFDSVSWRFLDHVMERLGFSSTWRKWIMAGLKSSRASILVMDSPTSEFSLKRGLRQGDPLLENQSLKSYLYGVGVSSDDIESMAAGNMLSSGGRLSLINSSVRKPWLLLDITRLGVGSLKAFNNSLLLKWRWHLLNKPSALWVEVLKSIHGNEAGIELKGCQTNGLWARIVGTIYHLHSSGYVPLNSLSFKVNQNCLVRDRIVNGLWAWDWRRPVNGGRALADLNNLLMDIGSLNVEVDRDCVVSSLSIDGSYLLPIFGGLFVVGVTLKSRRYLPVMNGTYGTPRGKLQIGERRALCHFAPTCLDALAFLGNNHIFNFSRT